MAAAQYAQNEVNPLYTLSWVLCKTSVARKTAHAKQQMEKCGLTILRSTVDDLGACKLQDTEKCVQHIVGDDIAAAGHVPGILSRMSAIPQLVMPVFWMCCVPCRLRPFPVDCVALNLHQ